MLEHDGVLATSQISEKARHFSVAFPRHALFAFVFIELATPKVVLAATTRSLSGGWVTQQLRNATLTVACVRGGTSSTAEALMSRLHRRVCCRRAALAREA
jgi:hypothetical protein